MMRFYLLFIILIFIAFGCKKNKVEQKDKKVLVMAETSEMGKLMIEMYAYNESIKLQIINGNLKNDYPQRFDNIHSAVLTNPSVRDSSFESFSKQFIEAQKQVFVSQQEELTIHYNNAIHACISCHKVKCVGPIPRIKKLLIK